MTTLTKEAFEEILQSQIARAIAPINNRLSAVENNAHAGNLDDNEIRGLRADILEIDRRMNAMQNGFAVGKGRITASADFNGNGPISADEYKHFLPKRIEAMSLAECAIEDARAAGVSVQNTTELEAFLEGKRPGLAQQARSAV